MKGQSAGRPTKPHPEDAQEEVERTRLRVLDGMIAKPLCEALTVVLSVDGWRISSLSRNVKVARAFRYELVACTAFHLARAGKEEFMSARLRSHDITVVFRQSTDSGEADGDNARRAIIKLARALARMAAEEDDASEAGV